MVAKKKQKILCEKHVRKVNLNHLFMNLSKKVRKIFADRKIEDFFVVKMTRNSGIITKIEKEE